MVERRAQHTAQGEFILRATPGQFADMLKELANEFVAEELGNPFETIRSDETYAQVLCHPTTGKERMPCECIAIVEYIDDAKSLLTAVAQGVAGLFHMHLLRESNVALLVIFSEITERGWLDAETPFADHDSAPGINFKVGASPEAIREIVREQVGYAGFDPNQDPKPDVCWTFFQCTDLEQSGGRTCFSVTARLGWEGRKYDLESDKPTYIADFCLLPLNNFETRGEVLFLYSVPTLEKVVRDAVAFLVREAGAGRVQAGIVESAHLEPPTIQRQSPAPSDAPKTPKWTADRIALETYKATVKMLRANYVLVVLAILGLCVAVLTLLFSQGIFQNSTYAATPTFTPILVFPTPTP